MKDSKKSLTLIWLGLKRKGTLLTSSFGWVAEVLCWPSCIWWRFRCLISHVTGCGLALCPRTVTSPLPVYSDFCSCEWWLVLPSPWYCSTQWHFCLHTAVLCISMIYTKYQGWVFILPLQKWGHYRVNKGEVTWPVCQMQEPSKYQKAGFQI